MVKPRVIKARKKEEQVTDEVMVMKKKVERYATIELLFGQKAEEFKKATAGFTTEMAQIQETVLKYAEENELSTVDGIKFEAEIKPKTTTSIPPKRLHDMLTKQKKKAIFFEIIKVQLTEAKKVLGQVMLKPITVSETNKFFKIVVKRKP